MNKETNVNKETRVWISVILGNEKSMNREYIICCSGNDPLLFDTETDAKEFWIEYRDRFEFPYIRSYSIISDLKSAIFRTSYFTRYLKSITFHTTKVSDFSNIYLKLEYSWLYSHTVPIGQIKPKKQYFLHNWSEEETQYKNPVWYYDYQAKIDMDIVNNTIKNRDIIRRIEKLEESVYKKQKGEI